MNNKYFRVKNILIKLCCSVIIIGVVAEANADLLNNHENDIQSDFTLSVGYSYKQTDFIIQNYDTKTERARFKQFNAAPFFEISTPDILSRSKHWSFVLKWGYGESEVSRQIDKGQSVDFGTSMSIKYSYLLPYFHYSFQEEDVAPSNLNGFRLGAGYGIGTATIQGTAVFTNTGNTEVNQISESVLNSVVVFSADYRYKGFVTGLRLNSMTNMGIDSPPVHGFVNKEIIADIGYIFYF